MSPAISRRMHNTLRMVGNLAHDVDLVTSGGQSRGELVHPGGRGADFGGEVLREDENSHAVSDVGVGNEGRRT